MVGILPVGAFDSVFVVLLTGRGVIVTVLGDSQYRVHSSSKLCFRKHVMCTYPECAPIEKPDMPDLADISA